MAALCFLIAEVMIQTYWIIESVYLHKIMGIYIHKTVLTYIKPVFVYVCMLFYERVTLLVGP